MSSLVEAPVTSGEIAVGTRKERRIVETQEIRIRSTHRRRKVLTRVGVLAGFALAMVVYPVFGTIAPYADAAQSLPGVVKGQAPTTAMALLGGGPQLISSDLPVPSIDAGTAVLAADSEAVISPVPNCDPTTKVKGTNGRLTNASLCSLPQKGESLQPEAAVAFTVMNEFFRTVFGRNICLDDSYRSLSEQYGTRATRGYLAATPGTSMHGWGIAIDICKSDLTGAAGKWIKENAGLYGWENPYWAKTSKYEPWHYEYSQIAAKYYDSTWGSGNYSDGGSSGSSSKSSSSSSSSSSKSTTTKTTTEKDDSANEDEPSASTPTPAPTAGE